MCSFVRSSSACALLSDRPAIPSMLSGWPRSCRCISLRPDEGVVSWEAAVVIKILFRGLCCVSAALVATVAAAMRVLQILLQLVFFFWFSSPAWDFFSLFVGVFVVGFLCRLDGFSWSETSLICVRSSLQ